MTFEHDADDFEPVDANERCDADYGAYHIGRCVETRDEVALMFDTHWLHAVNGTQTLIEHSHLRSARRGFDRRDERIPALPDHASRTQKWYLVPRWLAS